MGDVVSLVEKAQQEVDQAEAERVAERMAKGQFTLDDFLGQLRTIRRLGPIKKVLGMLPGVGGMLKDLPIDDGQLDRVEGMVRSMTPDERGNVRLVDQQKSRARRVAQGSGVAQQEVGRLAKQFEMMQKMTQQMAGMGAMGKMRAMQGIAGGAAGMGGFTGRGSTQTQSIKSKFKQRKKR
jgi:signal recognition particle subunit SRP54